MTERIHIPVLLHETIDNLLIQKGDVVLDATFGGGGHTEAILEKYGNTITVIALDTDEEAYKRAQMLATHHKNLIPVHANFRNIDTVSPAPNKVLFDLGVSSFQFGASGRGFTFTHDEPLHMGMSISVPFTAYDIVNSWKEETIADILYAYGEEKKARVIARAIVEHRKKNKINTTGELAALVTEALGGRKGPISPATKTFQALRIAVNDELQALRDGLEKSIACIPKGGRIAVISFHSLEDRIVKKLFQECQKDTIVSLITKKPITPSREEIKNNPRSRSAKLRIIQKI